VIGELTGVLNAMRALLPLLVTGVSSVLWWAWTESVGAGDLRAYGLVQFLPVVFVILMLFMYDAPTHFKAYITGMIVLYGLAKVCEQFDAEIFGRLGWTSGHALKHVLSAVASAAVLLMLYRRVTGKKRVQANEKAG